MYYFTYVLVFLATLAHQQRFAHAIVVVSKKLRFLNLEKNERKNLSDFEPPLKAKNKSNFYHVLHALTMKWLRTKKKEKNIISSTSNDYIHFSSFDTCWLYVIPF